MKIGDDLMSLDTPVLWVDLDTMEKNIQVMAERIKEAGMLWRPHTKGIKVPEIAHMLLRAGAMGVTVAKLGEAEVMAAAGINDILVANQVVGEQKIKRLVALCRHADVMIAVDDVQNARDIAAAAADAGVEIRVLIELNVGMDRAGIEPGQTTLEFAQQIKDLPGLKFSGLMAWEGHVVGILDPQEKKKVGEKAIQALVDTADLLRSNGIEVDIVSCGGSGSYKITSTFPGVTEIQAGGAIFGDETYKKWGADTQLSLNVLTTVSSHAYPQRAIVDAGRKAMNCDVSMPEPTNAEKIKLVGLSAEHGFVEVQEGAAIKVGDKVNFTVGYGDWTVFLHDVLVGVRQGKVEIIWNVLGRGKLS